MSREWDLWLLHSAVLLERPGAVHLELPEDIASEETDAPIIQRSRFDIPHASDESISQTLKLIESANSPLLCRANSYLERKTDPVLCFLYSRSYWQLKQASSMRLPLILIYRPNIIGFQFFTRHLLRCLLL